jgi:hypothetical protein
LTKYVRFAESRGKFSVFMCGLTPLFTRAFRASRATIC